jgi:outer membrane lipoprotein carrier protein
MRAGKGLVMMQWIAAILFVLVTMLPMSAIGDPGDVGPTVKRLEQAYEAFQDMQAAFKQETTSGAIGVVQRAAGRVYFKKAGRMLWKYETPEEQLIVLDGKTLWFYLPAEKQAMKNNFSIIPRHIVADLFRGSMDVLEKFKVRFAPREPDDAPGQVMLELVPVEPDPTVSKLIVWLDPVSYMIRKTSLTDSFGNRTDLSFEDIKVDQGLSDSMFAFTPPEGVDVFEPPQL